MICLLSLSRRRSFPFILLASSQKHLTGFASFGAFFSQPVLFYWGDLVYRHKQPLTVFKGTQACALKNMVQWRYCVVTLVFSVFT